MNNLPRPAAYSSDVFDDDEMEPPAPKRTKYNGSRQSRFYVKPDGFDVDLNFSFGNLRSLLSTCSCATTYWLLHNLIFGPNAEKFFLSQTTFVSLLINSALLLTLPGRTSSYIKVLIQISLSITLFVFLYDIVPQSTDWAK